MNRYSLTHLTKGALVDGLGAAFGREHFALADVLAYIAEVESQQAYREAGYPSLHDLCVLKFHLSHDAAKKRIHAAHAARRFPAIFPRVAEGALCLSVVNLLAPHLTPENAAELLAAASRKPRAEVEEMLAARCPQDAVPTTVEPIAQALTLGSDDAAATTCGLPGAPGHLQEVAKPRLVPIATDLYKLQLTMTGTMYQKLRHARDLLGNRKPLRDEAEVLELALDTLVEKLERKKFSATDKPRAPRRAKSSSSHVPAHVQREVWERDGGQCTFRNAEGMRCPARRDLEYEHIIPQAQGGSSDKTNVTLHCRAHNQLAAESVYGKAFMDHKREQAKAAAAERKAEKEAEREQERAAAVTRRSEKEAEREQARSATAARKAEREAERAQAKAAAEGRRAEREAKRAESEAKRAAEAALDDDILMPGLRKLGYTRDEARRALRESPPVGGEKLEDRVRRILRSRAVWLNGAVAS